MRKTKSKKPFSAKSVNQPPTKPKNKDQRQREYLTNHEVEQLRKAALQQGRNGLRDNTLILLMFRHALRVSEAITLRWEQVDLKAGLLHVNRRKNGLPSTHPLRGIELRALRQLQQSNSQNTYVLAPTA